MEIIAELILIFIVYYEYKKLKILVSPTVILGGIYLLFIPLINIIGVSMGFFKLEDLTIALFCLFLVELFLVGIFVNFAYKSQASTAVSAKVISNKLIENKDILTGIYLVSLICYIINLLQVISIYGIDNTKSKGFGPFAHLGFFSRCLMPIMAFYLVKSKKFKYAIFIMIHLIALITFKGKYHLYIPVMGAVIVVLFQNRKVKIFTILKVVFCSMFGAVALFIGVYSFIPNILAGTLNVYTLKKGTVFSVRHFFEYLFDPFIASNKFFTTPEYRGISDGIKVIIHPIDTLWQFISRQCDYYSPVIDLWPIVNSSGVTGNVGGIFSESVVLIGYIPAIIYICFIAIFVYTFFNITYRYGRYFLTTTYLLSVLTMSFFCNYFTLYPNFECFVYCVLVDWFVLDKRIIVKRRKVCWRRI